jgi:hypothetical protein
VFPAAVQHSQYNKPDPVIALMTAASVFVTLLYLERGGNAYALASGMAVGLAASAKYNGILVVVPFVLAVFFRHGAQALARPDLYVGARAPSSASHGLPVLPDRDPPLPRPGRLRHLHLRLRRARGAEASTTGGATRPIPIATGGFAAAWSASAASASPLAHQPRRAVSSPSRDVTATTARSASTSAAT